MKYYLYTHTRLDKNEIFYVGTGTKPKQYENGSFKQQHSRAFRKSDRSFIWNGIINITKYSIDIIQEFENKDECLKEETRLILKYGRIINNTGTLANLVSCNDEIKLILSKVGIRNGKRKMIKTFKYTLNGDYVEEYESMTDAALKNNTLPTDILMCIKNKKYSTGGFMWKNYKIGKITSYEDVINSHKIKLLQFDTHNNFIKEWNNIPEAAKSLNVCTSAIRNVICGLSFSCKGYKWVHDIEKLTPPITPIVAIYDSLMNLIGRFFTFTEAEQKLNLPKNCIPVYLRRGMKHNKYIFIRLK